MHAAAAPLLCDVLVVEDDRDTREVLVLLLRRRGCDVRAAASVGEALLALEYSLPSHILLDLMLPDADGVVLLQSVRRRELPILVAIVSAAGPTSQIVAHAMRWRPDAVMHKPICFQDIESWLR